MPPRYGGCRARSYVWLGCVYVGLETLGPFMQFTHHRRHVGKSLVRHPARQPHRALQSLRRLRAASALACVAALLSARGRLCNPVAQRMPNFRTLTMSVLQGVKSLALWFALPMG